MSEETIINGIDVSEYFIDVVDEGGGTIDYKILPNSERLLVEKIYKQNQQLKRLQEENKRLQMLSCANCGEKYLSPDGAELYDKILDYKQALVEIREMLKIAERAKSANKHFEYMDKALVKANEVLNDRD